MSKDVTSDFLNSGFCSDLSEFKEDNAVQSKAASSAIDEVLAFNGEFKRIPELLGNFHIIRLYHIRLLEILKSFIHFTDNSDAPTSEHSLSDAIHRCCKYSLLQNCSFSYHNVYLLLSVIVSRIFFGIKLNH